MRRLGAQAAVTDGRLEFGHSGRETAVTDRRYRLFRQALRGVSTRLGSSRVLDHCQNQPGGQFDTVSIDGLGDIGRGMGCPPGMAGPLSAGLPDGQRLHQRPPDCHGSTRNHRRACPHPIVARPEKSPGGRPGRAGGSSFDFGCQRPVGSRCNQPRQFRAQRWRANIGCRQRQPQRSRPGPGQPTQCLPRSLHRPHSGRLKA